MTKNITIVTLNQPNITDFAKARNKAMGSIKTDWILFLDTDEQLTPELKKEIKTVIKNKQHN